MLVIDALYGCVPESIAFAIYGNVLNRWKFGSLGDNIRPPTLLN